MGAIVLRRIRSSTILETLVALTILLIVFGIATSLFVKATLNNGSEKLLIAEELLNQFSKTTQKDKAFEDEIVKKMNFILERKIQNYDSTSLIFNVHFLISDENGKVLLQRNELILND